MQDKDTYILPHQPVEDDFFVAPVTFRGKPYWAAIYEGCLFPADDAFGQERALLYLNAKIKQHEKVIK